MPVSKKSTPIRNQPISKKQSVIIEHDPILQNQPVSDTTPVPVGLKSVPSSLVPRVDSFSLVAAAVLSGKGTSGMDFKGNTGLWLHSESPIMTNDLFAVMDAECGFLFIQKDMPRKVWRQDLSKPPLRRQDIPDYQDESLWPLNQKGKREDPVKEFITIDFLRLRDGLTGKYEAKSFSAVFSTGNFLRQIGHMRAGRDILAKPIVMPGNQRQESGTIGYYVPYYKVCGWIIPDGAGGWCLEMDKDRPAVRDTLDDELPF